MRKFTLAIFFHTVVCISVVIAQHDLVNQYSSKQYNAHTLMWDMVGDEHGYLWFANNDGVVRFDGNNWITFPTPNPVRSLVVTKRGEIFVACLEDFGVLTFTSSGGTQFISFKKQLDVSQVAGGGGEKVFMMDDNVYFSSGHSIFTVSKQHGEYKITVVDKEKNLGCGVLQHKLFSNHTRQGFGWIQGGRFTPLRNGYELAGKQIVQTVSFAKQDLIFTNYDGVYRLKDNILSKVLQNALTGFTMNGVADAVVIGHQKLAVATYHDGVKIFDSNMQEITIPELPSREIYQLGADHEQNLWISHLKGITQVLTGLPATTFKYPAVSGYINKIEKLGGNIYLSSTNGLFATTSGNPTHITPIAGMNTECWDIQPFHHTLYVATTNGLYTVDGLNTKLVVPNETFTQLQVSNLSGKLYAFGLNNCFTVDEYQTIIPLKNFTTTSNSVFENKDGSIWVGTNHNGLMHITTNGKGQLEIPMELTTGEVRIRIIDGSPLFQSKEAVFRFEGSTFRKDEELSKLWMGNRNSELTQQNNWLFTDKEWKLTVAGKPVTAHIAYGLNGKPTTVFHEKDKDWFATEDNMYWINAGLNKPDRLIANVSRVEYGKEGVAFSGLFVTQNDEVSIVQDIIPEIQHNEQIITIWFGLNSFYNPAKNQYRYTITGINEEWSEWSDESKLTLSGLPAGSYTLTVQARDAFGDESETGSYTFYIKPAWYLSGIAFMVYILGLFLVMYGVVLLYNKRLVFKNKELEQRVQERTVELKNEKQKSDALLLNILPEGVAEELKNKGYAEAKQYNHVTVLFTDMVNFTGISEQMTPRELVAEIHQNFTAFDTIIEKHGLEKIKTIGDAYLAVSGLPIEHHNHAQRVAAAALDIQQYMAQNNGKFQIRIGLHSGPVVAGIVGVKKYAFDIWGDTVNMAARMEQNSEAGKINISAATYELIKDDFTCEYRGKINAKNKGEVDMYFVVS
ncbi:MAG: adenylate/guanylate cyclase domain-containing protein [Bacteroidota bacterium]